MTQIIETGARIYQDFDTLLPVLSGVFLGIEKSGPGTLLAAALGDKCAGVGRDPIDCPTNTIYFKDTGFHPDYQDTYNQPYHLWGYIANTAVPGNSFKGGLGVLEAIYGNLGHEITQSILQYPDDGWGTSWQDFVLSDKGMYIGALITTGSIEPDELANVVRTSIGNQGFGSEGSFQRLNDFWGPLAGQQLP